MKDRRAQLAIGAVLLILGFLAIVQLRAQGGGTGLENLTSQDLSSLIANLSVRNDQLAVEVSTLQNQLGSLQAEQARGQTSAGDLRAELRQLRLWTGLDPVQGQGVQVEASGPIDGEAVNDILNELRGAGAEALAIESVRIVPGTVVAGPSGELSVENVAIPPTFTVSAIGNPINLTAALTRVGGVISRIQVASPDVQIVVTPSDSLQLPATTRNLTPQDGHPRA